MRYLTLILCVIFLAGCRGNDDPQSNDQPTAVIEQAPTDAPEQVTEEPTVQVFVRNTLPPTWTPVPLEQEDWFDPTETPRPASEQRQQRAGVREEWTPVFVPTFVPECNDFTVSEVEERFVSIGHEPVLGWSAVFNAQLYHLRVFNEVDETIYERLLTDLYHQLPATLFTTDGVYGWTVTPLDALGFPMCLGSGDYFVVGDI
jgi:hypothetical protein